ncbi:sirohydrochlorin chelatase [Saccharothrix sp. ST-888]|uniref:sirohydrochlorin chelatase n=1 Tax=Saccharothrix sp. ST-888 TaxID=1427391 RepID=UPI0009E560D9|nr:sirohydrochlorin chelatase [Saccharothrix sp. ST-888]
MSTSRLSAAAPNRLTTGPGAAAAACPDATRHLDGPHPLTARPSAPAGAPAARTADSAAAPARPLADRALPLNQARSRTRLPVRPESAGAPDGRPRPQTDAPALLLIAHGSRDPRHAATVDALVRRLRSLRPALEVATAYLDHCAPRIPQVLGRLDGAPAVAVPLLLNRAFHAKSDIPAALCEAGADLPLADVLGPSPLLLDALDRRLAESGLDLGSAAVRAGTGVVLAAAGSSDPAADAATRALAADWQRTRGWAAVEVAYASATGPRVPDAVAALRASGVRQVAVAPYLLAPGLLPDRIASAATDAAAELIAPVLGAAPEIARLLVHRYDLADRATRTTRITSLTA